MWADIKAFTNNDTFQKKNHFALINPEKKISYELATKKKHDFENISRMTKLIKNENNPTKYITPFVRDFL